MTRSPVWHPFAQHALEEPFTRIVATQDAYLIDERGGRIFDAVSSWWVVTHGHRNARIMEAIREATAAYDQVIFAEFTHEPAEALAARLLDFAPDGLEHVFYSDSGSTAVEVAVKMALGFFHNRGVARDRLVVLEHGYHGDTVGSMSLGERGVFNAPFEPLLFDVERLPFPKLGREQDTLARFEEIGREGRAAAVLVEPLVLGAGGMKMYGPEVLASLREIASRHGCLFIADEVMTGWGRTGARFACDQAGVSPDVLCTSKGLTGGSLPLAATLCTAEIFESHLSSDRGKMFFHSSSYTANPIACAAAVANLDVWVEEPVDARIASLEAEHARHLQRFEGDPRFSDVRQSGTIAALDLAVESPGYLAEAGLRMRKLFRERGMLIRPLGNVFYLIPPYCSTPEALSAAYEAIDEVASMVLREARS